MHHISRATRQLVKMRITNADRVRAGHGPRRRLGYSRGPGSTMSDGFLITLTLISAIGTGMVAGVFFAFSTFIMKALARLPSAHGIAAMQSINAAAPSPLFVVALFGTGFACVALVVSSLFTWNEPGTFLRFVGGALYLIGPILLTIAYNVPLNDALAKIDPNSVDAESHWRRYLAVWTAWNHVRTGTSLAAAVTFTLALRL